MLGYDGKISVVSKLEQAKIRTGCWEKAVRMETFMSQLEYGENESGSL